MTSQHHKKACRCPFDSLENPLCFEHKSPPPFKSDLPLYNRSLSDKVVLSMFSDTNIQVDSTAKLQLTVNEVKQIHRKRVASIIGHVFQLTYAAICDKLIQEANVNHCDGCAIHHPSQKEHSCLMMDNEDAWIYDHNEARVKTDLTTVKKTAESVCSDLGFTLGQTWESYLTELRKFPWSSTYLTSLELEHCCDQNVKNHSFALYYGPNGLRGNDCIVFDGDEAFDETASRVDPTGTECPETILRKNQELMDVDLVINVIHNKPCL